MQPGLHHHGNLLEYQEQKEASLPTPHLPTQLGVSLTIQLSRPIAQAYPDMDAEQRTEFITLLHRNMENACFKAMADWEKDHGLTD